jgi:hypothetical protein
MEVTKWISIHASPTNTKTLYRVDSILRKKVCRYKYMQAVDDFPNKAHIHDRYRSFYAMERAVYGGQSNATTLMSQPCTQTTRRLRLLTGPCPPPGSRDVRPYTITCRDFHTVRAADWGKTYEAAYCTYRGSIPRGRCVYTTTVIVARTTEGWRVY